MAFWLKPLLSNCCNENAHTALKLLLRRVPSIPRRDGLPALWDCLDTDPRVQRHDPKYRDVEHRIRKLQGAADRREIQQHTVRDEDFDAAFDDLMDDEPRNKIG